MTSKSATNLDDIGKHRLIKVKAISAMCESCFQPVSFVFIKNNCDKIAADDHVMLYYIML